MLNKIINKIRSLKKESKYHKFRIGDRVEVVFPDKYSLGSWTNKGYSAKFWKIWETLPKPWKGEIQEFYYNDGYRILLDDYPDLIAIEERFLKPLDERIKLVYKRRTSSDYPSWDIYIKDEKREWKEIKSFIFSFVETAHSNRMNLILSY